MHKKDYLRTGVFASILLCLLLVGCGPSAEEKAATSAALTAAAATDTPAPTLTPIDTLTPTTTPTFTPTETPSPTPLPGKQVYPIDTLSQEIPWLPLDIDKLPTSSYYGFNFNQPPFNNVLVRRAFAAAVDREVIAKLADEFYFEHVRPSTSLTPSETLGRDLYGEVGVPFDPVKARDLLAEAGYETIESFPAVTLVVSTRGEAAPGAYFRMADAITTMWKEYLGVSVEIRAYQDDRYYFQTVLREELPHIYQLAWGADINDPDNFLRELFHSGSHLNHGHFASNEFDRLVERAAQSDNPAERQQLYIQAERILTEDLVAIIPLYHSYFYPIY